MILQKENARWYLDATPEERIAWKEKKGWFIVHGGYFQEGDMWIAFDCRPGYGDELFQEEFKHKGPAMLYALNN